ncbi:LOW QUALITY PROTEIN: hypothetical protein V2J09_003086 [Rumex salicifolius]
MEKTIGSGFWTRLTRPYGPSFSGTETRPRLVTRLFTQSTEGAKDRLFTGVDLEGCGYDVTHYLYAPQGADSCDRSDLRKKLSSKAYLRNKQSHRRWAGYVAVSNDDRSARMGHRDITIAWQFGLNSTQRF